MICARFPGLSGKCVRPSPCFAELMRYDVLAGRSFVVGSYRRIVPDPGTKVCRPSDKESPLYVERVPVGLPIYPVLLGPECKSPVNPLDLPDANPCFERSPSGYVGYEDKTTSLSVSIAPASGPSTVVRYSNPDIWFSLGVSHLARATTVTPTVDGGVAPTSAVTPPMPQRGLTLQLDVGSGFSRLAVPISNVTSLPAWIVEAPDNYVYVVDVGDRTGTTGTRGQVLRFSRSFIVVDNFSVK
jgi:hypothetical protein